MKKFFSIRYGTASFDFSMLLLRLVFAGFLLCQHGLHKLMHFNELVPKFYNFLGLGQQFSLVLVIFAEVFCSIFVMLGLFTRIAVFPILIAMLVALLGVHGQSIFKDGEMAMLFATVFFVLLLCGPGRMSIDGMLKG